jgi:hypothetical protein
MTKETDFDTLLVYVHRMCWRTLVGQNPAIHGDDFTFNPPVVMCEEECGQPAYSEVVTLYITAALCEDCLVNFIGDCFIDWKHVKLKFDENL